MKRMDDNRGETLVEILIAVILVGLVVSALFQEYFVASRAADVQRDVVVADKILRNTAESIKGAVRHDCSSNTTYTTTTTAPPAGWAQPTITPASTTCPAVSTVQTVTITLDLPNSTPQKPNQRVLQINVRTP